MATPGRRGGTTTQRRGKRRKSLWLYESVALALERAALEERTSEAAIVERALREQLGLAEDEDEDEDEHEDESA